MMSSLRSQEKNSGIKGGTLYVTFIKISVLTDNTFPLYHVLGSRISAHPWNLFYVSFGNTGLAGTGETDWEPVPVAIVTVDSSSANAASFLTFLNETDQDMIDIHSYKTEKAAKNRSGGRKYPASIT